MQNFVNLLKSTNFLYKNSKNLILLSGNYHMLNIETYFQFRLLKKAIRPTS